MSKVSVSGLQKRYNGKPPTVAIDDLDLEIQEGEFLVLLGPSGCGKTTTLRCLAGLETADAGKIMLGDEVVYDQERRVNLPPNKRNLGMVFQSYALWPHMTVRKNMAFPLRARKNKQAMKDGWVEQVAEVVDCSELLDRYPGQLSGGQQQRVALARGLVARPNLVLFDEPLSNLDAKLRDSLRLELAELHAKLKFTAVYVTHDQAEAMALGDRIAIMRKGAIEQLGTPQEVFRSPNSEYVADFIGMKNRLAFTSDGAHWKFGKQAVANSTQEQEQQQIVMRARPEDLSVLQGGLQDRDRTDGRLYLSGIVKMSTYAGNYFDVSIETESKRVHVRAPALATSSTFSAGDPVSVVVDPRNAAAFHPDGSKVDNVEALLHIDSRAVAI